MPERGTTKTEECFVAECTRELGKRMVTVRLLSNGTAQTATRRFRLRHD